MYQIERARVLAPLTFSFGYTKLVLNLFYAIFARLKTENLAT